MKTGDLVTRKSYNNDIIFRLTDISKNKAILSAVDYRLTADADLSDLQYANTRKTADIEPINEGDVYPFRIFHKPKPIDEDIIPPKLIPIKSSLKCGTILHLDGDPYYLGLSLSIYNEAHLSAVGLNIEEENQPRMILDLLKTYKPNILVITGHDSLRKDIKYSSDINDYMNSKYFIESIKIAREYNPNYDELVIIAGGCKSYYEELMSAGANFASSPDRILINIADPVNVACKLANTSVTKFLDMDTIQKEAFINPGTIGGIETRGQCRKVKPSF